MKVNFCSCLLLLVLSCDVTAGIINNVVEEKQQATLRCPLSEENIVTWSRERNGNRRDLITIVGDRETRLNDPKRRFNSLADKSLVIINTVVSDSGQYFCNNEPAGSLTVISSGPRPGPPGPRPGPQPQPPGPGPGSLPSGPGSGSGPGPEPGPGSGHGPDSPPQSTMTTSQTSKSPPTAAAAPSSVLVLVTVVPSLLLLLIIIIFILIRRHRSKRPENEDLCVVYEEIQENSTCQQPKVNITGSTATYSLAGFPADSYNQDEATYATIPNPPLTKNEPQSPYSLVGGSVVDGNNKGSSLSTGNTYALLQKPNAPRNNQ